VDEKDRKEKKVQNELLKEMARLENENFEFQKELKLYKDYLRTKILNYTIYLIFRSIYHIF